MNIALRVAAECDSLVIPKLNVHQFVKEVEFFNSVNVGVMLDR